MFHNHKMPSLSFYFAQIICNMRDNTPIISPALKRKRAREVFEETRECVFQKNDLHTLDGHLIQGLLKNAGEDINSDRPYKRVLKLPGGKAEFEHEMIKRGMRLK